MSRIDGGHSEVRQNFETKLQNVKVGRTPEPVARPMGKINRPGTLNSQKPVRADGSPVDFGGEAPPTIMGRPVPKALLHHTPAAPEMKGIELSYDILEDKTGHAVSVEYYDADQKKWVVVGQKGKGKGKEVTSETGTADGGSLFIPYQNGKPPVIRMSNNTAGAYTYGEGAVGADGKTTYKWANVDRRYQSDFDTVVRGFVSGGMSSIFDNATGGVFPFVKESENADGTHTVAWRDGGANKTFDKKRANITITYKDASEPTKGYAETPDSKVEKFTAYDTLYALNGNKPVTARDMEGLIKSGIVVVHPDGTWELNPETLTEGHMKVIVVNILKDKKLTEQQKDHLLTSVGVDKETMHLIDTKFGNNDGAFTASDITEATTIDPKTGKAKPYEVNFALQKGAKGEFIKIEPQDGRTAAVLPYKEPKSPVTEKSHGKYHDGLKKNYDKTQLSNDISAAKNGGDNWVTETVDFFEAEGKNLEKEGLEVYDYYKKELEKRADPKHPEHGKYLAFKQEVEAAEKKSGGKRISVVTVGAMMEFHFKGVNRHPTVLAFMGRLERLGRRADAFLRRLSPFSVTPSIITSPRVSFTATDLLKPNAPDPTMVITLRVGYQETAAGRLNPDVFGGRHADVVGGVAYSELGIEFSMTVGLKDPLGSAPREVSIGAEYEAGALGSLNGGTYFPSFGGVNIRGGAIVKGEAKTIWLRGPDGKIDKRPDIEQLTVTATVPAGDGFFNANSYAGPNNDGFVLPGPGGGFNPPTRGGGGGRTPPGWSVNTVIPTWAIVNGYGYQFGISEEGKKKLNEKPVPYRPY
jgi:hypothetical protein